MGRNLGPLNIKDSYEGLVQISGSQLTDGSGSLISSLEVTASYATTADASISASYAQTSVSSSHALYSDASGTSVSASYAVSSSHSTYAETAGFATSSLSSSYAVSSSHSTYAETAGFATDVNALYTASVVDATISFLKGGGGTFPITIDNVANAVSSSHSLVSDTSISASYALTASYLEGGVPTQHYKM